MSEHTSSADPTKRDFLKKASYAVPAVLTLAAAPSFASAGSNSRGKKPKEDYKYKGKRKGKKHDD